MIACSSPATRFLSWSDGHHPACLSQEPSGASTESSQVPSLDGLRPPFFGGRALSSHLSHGPITGLLASIQCVISSCKNTL